MVGKSITDTCFHVSRSCLESTELSGAWKGEGTEDSAILGVRGRVCVLPYM